MTQDATVVIRFKDIEHDEDVHDHLERRLRRITETFPEATHCELSLVADAIEVSAHAHASGKRFDLAARAATQDTRAAGELAIGRLERELRREHDKRIFARRRTAQRDQARRRSD
jgi:ribosome-associated translation inhibitor RaiA